MRYTAIPLDKAIALRDEELPNTTWTVYCRPGDEFSELVCRFYSTPILKMRLEDDGNWSTEQRLSFDVEEFRTLTTLRRLNQITPDDLRFFRKNGRWYIRDLKSESTFPFHNNIELVYKNGWRPTCPLPTANKAGVSKPVARMIRQWASYGIPGITGVCPLCVNGDELFATLDNGVHERNHLLGHLLDGVGRRHGPPWPFVAGIIRQQGGNPLALRGWPAAIYQHLTAYAYRTLGGTNG